MNDTTEVATTSNQIRLGQSDDEIVVPKWPKIELTPEFKKDILKAFTMFDENGEGTVPVDAVRVCFRALGYDTNASEFKELQQQTKDCHSRVDFGEFLSLLTDRMLSLDSDMNIMKSFELMDQGNKGYIDLDDLRQAATKLELKEMYDDDFAAMLLGGQVNDTSEELEQFYEEQQRRARIRKGKAYGVTNEPPDAMLSVNPIFPAGTNAITGGLPGFQRARRLSSSALPSPETLTVNFEQFRCLMQMTQPPSEDRRLI